MKPSEEVHHISLMFEQMSGDNDRLLKLVENLKEAAISYLLRGEDLIPPDADLTNYDQAVCYCLEIQRNPQYALYRDAALILRTCIHALETGKVDNNHIRVIIGSWAGINKAEETKTFLNQFLPLTSLFPKRENVDDRAMYQQQKTKEENFIHHKGEGWEVGYGGKTAIMQNLKGIAYIAVLIDKSGTSVPCRELYQINSEKLPDDTMTEIDAINEGLSIGESKQAKNDTMAQQDYQKKYEELKNDFRTAESDLERQEIVSDMKIISSLLREKNFNNEDAKFQSLVGKRLRKAYKSLKQARLNEMAVHLDKYIQPDGNYGLSYNGVEFVKWDIDL